MGRDSEQLEALSGDPVILELQGFCIQTAARRARQRLVDAMLTGTTCGADVEARVELLGRFLETTDFVSLRAEHPELAGGTICRVALHQSKDGTVCWELLHSP